MDTILCRSVTKNLTPYRFNSAGLGLDDMKAEIHSFPTMYIIGGGEVGSKWVKTKIFRKKVVKKQLFCVAQIRINWLWGGLRPIFLKVSLTSACVLKRVEHNLRNELCARRQSSIVSDWRPLENYFESDTEKCKKRLFFGFPQITWDFDIETHIQGTTTWKLTSWRFRKCGGF